MNLFLSFSGGGAAWLWLVLVPVSGWLVMHSRPFRRYMWRASGYNRYFLIVLAGIIAFIVGVFLAPYAETAAAYLLPASAEVWQFPLKVGGVPPENLPLNPDFLLFFWGAPIGFLLGLVLSLAAFVLPALVFSLIGLVKNKQFVDAARANYLAKVNGLLGFVVEAHKRELIVMLTLRNRKIYIGWLQRLSDWNNPHPTNQYLYFLPLRSGYRDQATLEMVITTNYAGAHRKFGVDNLSPKAAEWEIILPVNEIVHAQPFDLKIYKETQWSGPAPKRKSRRKK